MLQKRIMKKFTKNSLGITNKLFIKLFYLAIIYLFKLKIYFEWKFISKELKLLFNSFFNKCIMKIRIK